MSCPNCSGYEVRCLSLDTGERWNKCLECGHEWSEFLGGKVFRPLGSTPLPYASLASLDSLSRPSPKKVYLAGPLRAATPYEIEQNVRRARSVAELLWKQGCAVFCPHLNTYGMVGMLEDENDFIKGDLLFLEGCDALVLLEGWTSSRGATREKHRAEELGIPILVVESVLGDPRFAAYDVHTWRERITEAMEDARHTSARPDPASVSSRTPLQEPSS